MINISNYINMNYYKDKKIIQEDILYQTQTQSNVKYHTQYKNLQVFINHMHTHPNTTYNCEIRTINKDLMPKEEFCKRLQNSKFAIRNMIEQKKYYRIEHTETYLQNKKLEPKNFNELLNQIDLCVDIATDNEDLINYQDDLLNNITDKEFESNKEYTKYIVENMDNDFFHQIFKFDVHVVYFSDFNNFEIVYNSTIMKCLYFASESKHYGIRMTTQ